MLSLFVGAFQKRMVGRDAHLLYVLFWYLCCKCRIAYYIVIISKVTFSTQIFLFDIQLVAVYNTTIFSFFSDTKY